jgi:hypothetical protein
VQENKMKEQKGSAEAQTHKAFNKDKMTRQPVAKSISLCQLARANLKLSEIPRFSILEHSQDLSVKRVHTGHKKAEEE